MEEGEEENYIVYGTPLPEIEDETAIRKKAAKELQVRDEKGRQRLHGAFTGGFSAGYFNTVGTKEGWAPSSFVSSRNKTAERIQQNPEDFMDDEDFGEFGIATRKIHTTSNFEDISDVNIRKRKFVDSDSVIPGEAPLKGIVKPVRESIGMKILKKLGWRFGQGIGPRVKKQMPSVKVYGCSLYPDADDHTDDDPTSLAYTFAPEDIDGMFYQPKDNLFGLGYSGLSKESVLSSHVDLFAPTTTKSWLAKDKKKLTISGQAFGVGAFEDDDEDIYAKDDMSRYDFSDIALKEAEDKQKESGSKHTPVSSNVLEGFHLASQPPLVKRHYPPPPIPPDFKPVHSHLLRNPVLNKHQITSRHSFSADERSHILGEKKFHSSQFLVDKQNKVKSQEKKETSVLDLPVKNVPGFRPFPNDPTKQERYEEYVKLQHLGEVEKLKQPSSMTEWEKQQEIEEFARAAVLFKPLSSILSSRFVSRSHLSVEHEVKDALEKIKEEKDKKASIVKRKLLGTSNRMITEWHPSSLLCKRFNVPNPYPNSSFDGIPEVHKKKSLFNQLSFAADTSESQNIASECNATTSLLPSKSAEISIETEVNTQQHLLSSDTTISNIEDHMPDNKRPPIDFFKDIFENSSSDEGDIAADQTEEASVHSVTSREDITEKDKEHTSEISLNNTAQNINFENKEHSVITGNEKVNIAKTSGATKKTGFGVFANIDLDALNQRTSAPKKIIQKILGTEVNDHGKKQDKSSDNNNKISVTDVEMEECNNCKSVAKPCSLEECYGPELPPDYSGSSSSAAVKIESKKHMKHKAKHKHKHHKHKSSKKKKKKSSRRNSTKTDSSDEPDDIPPTLIIEKLKKLQKGMM